MVSGALLHPKLQILDVRPLIAAGPYHVRTWHGRHLTVFFRMRRATLLLAGLIRMLVPGTVHCSLLLGLPDRELEQRFWRGKHTIEVVYHTVSS